MISFYRGAWCPCCNLELQALQQAFTEIKAIDAQLIAVSPNTPGNSLSSIKKHKFGFGCLVELNDSVVKEFGSMSSLAEELKPIRLQFDFNIPDY